MKFQILVAAFVLLYVVKQSEGECPNGKFTCADGSCIGLANKCDGILSSDSIFGSMNCPDDSDETYDLCNSISPRGGCFWDNEKRCPGKIGCFETCT